MMYYQVDCSVSYQLPEEEFRREFASDIQAKSDEFFRKSDQKSFVFVSRLGQEQVTAGVITRGDSFPRKLVEEFFSETKLTVGELEVREVTLSDMFYQLLRFADIKDFINDDDRTIERFGLFNPRNRSIVIGDYMQQLDLSAEQLRERAKKQMVDRSLIPELERIAAGSKIYGATGHPVHYIVRSDNAELRREMTDLLHRALYTAGRISSERVGVIISFEDEAPLLDQVYHSFAGGLLTVELTEPNENGGESLRVRSANEILVLCNTARKHCHSTLNVFCLPKSNRRLYEELLESLGDLPVVEITENDITPEDARAYLRRRAKEAGVRADSRLYSEVGGNSILTVTDLERHFDGWYSLKLRRSVYPQYSSIGSAHELDGDKSAPKGIAASELERMVGLSEAKRVIGRAVDYYKAQRLFADKGIKQKTPSMHMVFTGNPGTAKTTVARLFARIMKDNGLLSDGELLEVGRADLVGKYVGWTAKLVKSAFKRARGGVLFIDEAYSLLDDKEGLYGDEAINTIVQEMENNREDVVVIFAGYPDKMEAFMQRNPGLRSRIAFHVPFEDYNADQLCDIAAFMAAEQGMVYSEETRLKLHDIFENASQTEDFGNGRFVRNIIEQARMEQAGRLVRMNCDDVTIADIATLLPEDIVPPPALNTETPRMLGF